MSLVHKALEKLPERETADKKLPNPMQKLGSREAKKTLPWRLILLVGLALVALTQMAFLYTTGALAQWFDADSHGSETSQSLVVIAPADALQSSEPAAPVITIVSPVAVAPSSSPVSVADIPATAIEVTGINDPAPAAIRPSVITTQVSTLSRAVPTTNTGSASASQPDAVTPTESAVATIPVNDLAADTPARSDTVALPLAETNVEADVTQKAETAVTIATQGNKDMPESVPSAAVEAESIVPAKETLTTPAPAPAIQTATSASSPQNKPASTQNNGTIAATATTAATTRASTVANASVSAKHSIQDTQRIIAAASIALEQGNTSAAENLLLEALAQAPNNTAMTLAFARFWIKVGEYDAAAGVLAQLQAPEAIALRGLIHELKEQDGQAMALYQKLAEAQDLPSSYQLRYAVLLENNGNKRLAQQWYQHYLTLPEQTLAARQFAATRMQALSNP